MTRFNVSEVRRKGHLVRAVRHRSHSRSECASWSMRGCYRPGVERLEVRRMLSYDAGASPQTSMDGRQDN